MNMKPDIMVDERDVELLAAIEDGLPVCAYPYAEIGKLASMSEDEVISRLERMQDTGIIRRFGLVLQHHSLGYKANAMVVWNIPDDLVDEVALRIISHDFITLCYCRTRHAPVWPYNLYCMIHGCERRKVEQQIEMLKHNAGLAEFDSDTLFSVRRFKQRGARFSQTETQNPIVAT